jgi:hypothetical protein
MSPEMKTFVPIINDTMIPDWIARMNGLNMHCEIFPGFMFKDSGGFLPFQVVLNNAIQDQLRGIAFITGFEFYINDFSLDHEIDLNKPTPTLIGRLKRKKPKPVYFATPEIDRRLAACRKALRFVWGSGDTLELRMATLSALILADIAKGVCFYPVDNIWYTNSDAIEMALQEIEDYEASLNPNELVLHKFEGWL